MCDDSKKQCDIVPFKTVEFVELEWDGGRFLVAETEKAKVRYFQEEIDIQGRKFWNKGGDFNAVKPAFLAAVMHALNNKNKS